MGQKYKDEIDLNYAPGASKGQTEVLSKKERRREDHNGEGKNNR